MRAVSSRPLRVFVATTLIGACLCVARPVSAGQAPPASVAQTAGDVQQVRDEVARIKREFDVLRRQYDERLLALEQRLAQIGGPIAAPAAPQTPQPAPVAASSKVFNPDISVNGNFVGAAGKNGPAGLPPLQLSEVEAAFQAIVDPYAKADFFVALGPEGAEVEEGYITFTSLPANLLLKVGKMRAQFGKVNTLHTHSLPTVDRPLVTGNLVGGDEGISDAGLSLSHLVNTPHLYLEFTGEVYGGASEVFQSDARSKLTYVGRARAYKDITESSNIDVGTSVAVGRAGVGIGADGAFASVQTKQLIGVDATFRYRPLRRAIYQRLNLRTELIWSRQDLPDEPQARAFGVYAVGEYQLARRWYVGGRIDRSGRSVDARAIDLGQSVFMTFWPTEFSQVRGQYRRISFAEGIKSHEFLFQLNFSIGAHGAHIF